MPPPSSRPPCRSRCPAPTPVTPSLQLTGPLSTRGSFPMFQLLSLSPSMDVFRIQRTMRTDTREATMELMRTRAQSSPTSSLLDPFLDSTQMLALSKFLIKSSMAMCMMKDKDGSYTRPTETKRGRVSRGGMRE